MASAHLYCPLARRISSKRWMSTLPLRPDVLLAWSLEPAAGIPLLNGPIRSSSLYPAALWDLLGKAFVRYRNCSMRFLQRPRCLFHDDRISRARQRLQLCCSGDAAPVRDDTHLATPGALVHHQSGEQPQYFTPGMGRRHQGFAQVVVRGVPRLDCPKTAVWQWREARLGKNLGKYSFREWSLPITAARRGPLEPARTRATTLSGGDSTHQRPFLESRRPRCNMIESVKVVRSVGELQEHALQRYASLPPNSPRRRAAAAAFFSPAHVRCDLPALLSLQSPCPRSQRSSPPFPDLRSYKIALDQCGICHSADCINLQPPPSVFGCNRIADMVKMQHAYGAPFRRCGSPTSSASILASTYRGLGNLVTAADRAEAYLANGRARPAAAKRMSAPSWTATPAWVVAPPGKKSWDRHTTTSRVEVLRATVTQRASRSRRISVPVERANGARCLCRRFPISGAADL